MSTKLLAFAALAQLTLSMSSGSPYPPGALTYLQGSVETTKGEPVRHTKISIESDGSYETTDTGKFTINKLPPSVTWGRVVRLTMPGWYILDPNVGGSGRIPLPDPKEQPLTVKVTKKGDRVALFSHANIGNVLFERFFRLEEDENSASNGAFARPTHLVSAIMDHDIPRLRYLTYAQTRSPLRSADQSDSADNTRFIGIKSEEMGVPSSELRDAIRSWIKQAEEPYERALGALYIGDYKAAAELASRTSARDPKVEFERNVILSHAQFKLGLYEEARDSISRALTFHPGDETLQLNLAITKREIVLKKARPTSDSGCKTGPAVPKLSVSGIVIPTVPGVPFSAKITVEWSRKLEDERSACPRSYYTEVARDRVGRVRREVRRFPATEGAEPELVSFTIFDPEKHQKIQCFSEDLTCHYDSFNPPPLSVQGQPGVTEGGNRYMHREDLGTETFSGEKVMHTREVTQGKDDGTTTSLETWYSPRFQMNLQEIRISPMTGVVKLTVTNLNKQDPDAAYMQVPSNFKTDQ